MAQLLTPLVLLSIFVFMLGFGDVSEICAETTKSPEELEKLVENACYWHVPKLQDNVKKELKELIEQHEEKFSGREFNQELDAQLSRIGGMVGKAVPLLAGVRLFDELLSSTNWRESAKLSSEVKERLEKAEKLIHELSQSNLDDGKAFVRTVTEQILFDSTWIVSPAELNNLEAFLGIEKDKFRFKFARVFIDIILNADKSSPIQRYAMNISNDDCVLTVPLDYFFQYWTEMRSKKP